MTHRVSRRTAVQTILGGTAALAAGRARARANEPAPTTETIPLTGQANPDPAAIARDD